MKFLKKPSPEISVFLLFCLFLLFFILERGPIGTFSAFLLRMTDEIPKVAIEKVQNGPYKRGTRNSTKKRKKLLDKPTTTKLPKTKIPVVAWCDTLSISAANSPEFPPLRQYTGNSWLGDKIVIKAVTDGMRIKILFHLYDSEPDKAVTEHSRRNPSSAWQDDGIELFLMKDEDSEIYAQYVLSVIGRGAVFLMKCKKSNLSVGTRISTPSSFTLPLMSAKRVSDGFLLEITISLSNIGIDSLQPGDKLLMQIVRNYRGQGMKNSMALQLFPTHIYADNRHGANNHNRKAFVAAKIVNSNNLMKNK